MLYRVKGLEVLVPKILNLNSHTELIISGFKFNVNVIYMHIPYNLAESLPSSLIIIGKS